LLLSKNLGASFVASLPARVTFSSQRLARLSLLC
jgi:hypothetical protein